MHDTSVLQQQYNTAVGISARSFLKQDRRRLVVREDGMLEKKKRCAAVMADV